MISLGTLLLFAFAVIGMTHIIVDPATIMQPVRDSIAAKAEGGKFWSWLNKLLSCYQCCGTWVGFIVGAILISWNPLVIFVCGVAGSFLATWGATYLNYLEASSIISLDREDG